MLLSVVSFGLIRLTIGSPGRGPKPRGRRATWFAPFFLGAGFMLIETRSITELGLVFGNTWVVVAAVICGILVTAFLANLSVARLGNAPAWLAFCLLALSLVAGWVLSADGHLSRVWALILVSCPIFFAGLMFSRQIVDSPSLNEAFSANLLGSILGGFLEYLSLAVGIRNLYLVSLCLYLCAFLAGEMARKASVGALADLGDLGPQIAS